MTNPSSDVLERETVAKVIYDATHAGLSNCYSWDDEWENYQQAARDRYYREADAVIAHVSATIERLSAELERVKGEALDLTRRVRSLVRAENSRIHEARIRKLDVMDVGSRDDADRIQSNLYEAWPAKRLDALIAALTLPPTSKGERDAIHRNAEG